MSIRDLRTLIAIAELGSFAAASRAVSRTQPAITMQIKALEAQFGVALFDRTRRPPILSQNGRAFLSRAREIVDAYDQLYKLGFEHAAKAELNLGVVPSVITGIVPRALRLLRKRDSAIQVELTMGLSRELVERVEKGQLDAAIVSDFEPANSSMEWLPFAQEPFVLIAPMDAAAMPAEEMIRAYPYIRYSCKAWLAQRIDAFLKQRNLVVDEGMTLDTLEAITTMVHHGLGVSVVPQRACGNPAAMPVKHVAFACPTVSRIIGIVVVPGNAKRPLIELLLEVIKQASNPPLSLPLEAL